MEDIILNGVGGAVGGFGAAFTIPERDVGGAEIGAVVYDDTVGGEELHVHGGDANGWEEEGP